jgi:hypothetical protein
MLHNIDLVFIDVSSAGNGKPVQPPVDQDDEAQDEANSASNFDFDRFMAERGRLPRSGYATYRPPQGKPASAGDGAKVGGVRAGLERGFAGGGR